jgi:hypothetical protein
MAAALLAADGSLSRRCPQNAPRAREVALVCVSSEAPKPAGQSRYVNTMSSKEKPHDAGR